MCNSCHVLAQRGDSTHALCSPGGTSKQTLTSKIIKHSNADSVWLLGLPNNSPRIDQSPTSLEASKHLRFFLFCSLFLILHLYALKTPKCSKRCARMVHISLKAPNAYLRPLTYVADFITSAPRPLRTASPVRLRRSTHIFRLALQTHSSLLLLVRASLC